MPRRDSRNYDLALAIRNAVIRSIECDHNRAHLGMNIAKDEGDSRPVETNIASGPRFIKTKVESLALKERKDIVKKWITIGKLDHRPDRNHKQVWLEALMVLHQDQRLFGHELRWRFGANG